MVRSAYRRQAFARPPQSMPDRVDDIVRRSQNLIVPEAQNLEAIRAQPLCSMLVVHGTRLQVVLSSVDLNNQSAFKADKVHNVDAQSMLTSEIIAQRLISQAAPQATFCICHLAAKISDLMICHEISLGPTLPLWEGRNSRASATRISGRGSPLPADGSPSVSPAYPSPKNSALRLNFSTLPQGEGGNVRVGRGESRGDTEFLAMTA